MYAIVHALTGAFIGEEFHSIILIIIVSLIMHFIMDMIPHFDHKFDKDKLHNREDIKFSGRAKARIGMDFLFSFIIIGYLAYKFHNKLIVLGSFISLLPDIMCVGYKTKLRKNNSFMRFLKFHSKIQTETSFKISLIIHGIVIGILVILFFVF